METVSSMLDFIAVLLSSLPRKTAHDIRLACEEIVVNIASYAYPKEDGRLAIFWKNNTKRREVSIVFEDFGVPFNPLLKAEPKIDMPLAERKIGGLGIYITRKIMDDLQYDYKNGKNILTVKKKY